MEDQHSLLPGSSPMPDSPTCARGAARMPCLNVPAPSPHCCHSQPRPAIMVPTAGLLLWSPEPRPHRGAICGLSSQAHPLTSAWPHAVLGFISHCHPHTVGSPFSLSQAEHCQCAQPSTGTLWDVSSVCPASTWTQPGSSSPELGVPMPPLPSSMLRPQ
jgi:hypothetical protein